MFAVTACGTDPDPTLVASGSAPQDETSEASTTTSSSDALPVTTRPEIDSDAILTASGFKRCPESGPPTESDITVERGQELLYAAIHAGISQGGSPGGDGYLPMIDLYVLDETSLMTLAGIADPSELCVNGAVPNDFVALGPQALSAPGWRWVGAGSSNDFSG